MLNLLKVKLKFKVRLTMQEVRVRVRCLLRFKRSRLLRVGRGE